MESITVSACIIAYNEERFLPNLFADILLQTYPHELIEIVLVDGRSTDRTKQVMLDFVGENAGGFSRIVVVDNPKRVQPAGWNAALLNATGDVIVRIDAHTSIPPEFISLNVSNIKDGESVSGGVRPCLIENKTPWSDVLLQTENSLFGSSVSASRRGTSKQYVKTMFHACYRREVFEDVGGFNENLLRTEDNELHCRIRKAGYKLCFDPKIISYQYARSNLRKMIRQKYGNGYWIGLTVGVCPACISLYHLIPAAFVAGIVVTAAFAAIGIWQLAAIMWAAYLLFALFSMAASMRGNGFSVCQLLMPALFLILHVCYGVGTIIGLIQMPWRRKKLRDCPTVGQVKAHMAKNLKK